MQAKAQKRTAIPKAKKIIPNHLLSTWTTAQALPAIIGDEFCKKKYIRTAY
ncbi:MAG: hypothetical protein JNM01_10200 [Delftia acidovorans]|uniref:hypothetical protein n=1 Tax=Delftia sp. UME58 TaxID=1862322 RepID=UPI00160038D6|nr:MULTISPECIES: hypothetical protein [Delftia]MBL8355192.1 hypothetical protein [Delftia acidovorans]